MKLPDLSRRKLFKLSGGGFLAGIVGGSPVSVPPAFAPITGSGAVGESPLPSTGREGWRLMDAWRGMRAPNAHQYKVRTGDGMGLDPDIACLRSVSPVMKAWMQRERDLAIDSQMEIMAKFFGVDHW